VSDRQLTSRPVTLVRFVVVQAHVVPEEKITMAIEVRIPTILRSYTGGAKTVEGSGDTIADLLTDLDSRHAGIKDRLITGEGGLHRFVNVYINDEDVRFLGALDAKVNDGDSVTILPAVAGGAFAFAAAHALRG
jgi:molybdopterin synthase sulfur carrier subunit